MLTLLLWTNDWGKRGKQMCSNTINRWFFVVFVVFFIRLHLKESKECQALLLWMTSSTRLESTVMASVWILCQVRRTGAWNTGGLAHTGPATRAQVEAGPEDE